MTLNTTDEIISRADKLVKQTGSRNPEQIARELGIIIKNVPFKSQKGVYKIIERNRFIFIKEDLDERMRRIVLLHEIGHVMTGAFYSGKPAADSWAAAERAADSWAKQFLDNCGGCVV